MADLSEKVKIKWIKEIIEEDKKRNIIYVDIIKTGDINETPSGGDTFKTEPPVSIKKKFLSMRDLVKGQKVIKNIDDIDQVLESLKYKLIEELEEDTIINLI